MFARLTPRLTSPRLRGEVDAPQARSRASSTRYGAAGEGDSLQGAQLEALYGSPVEIVTDAATGASAFLPGWVAKPGE